MLDDNNIPQADATVIAGLLILTIVYASTRRDPHEVAGLFTEQAAIDVSRQDAAFLSIKPVSVF
jgi:hypothetical protein